MYVYLNGDKQRSAPKSVLRVAPAATLPANEGPSNWLQNGEPRTFTIEFAFGRANVDERLGAWLIATGQAQRTDIIHRPADVLLGSLAATIAGQRNGAR